MHLEKGRVVHNRNTRDSDKGPSGTQIRYSGAGNIWYRPSGTGALVPLLQRDIYGKIRYSHSLLVRDGVFRDVQSSP